MRVELSSERERFVQRCLKEARFATPEALVETALREYETRNDGGPLRRAVLVGLEQAVAGRAGAVTLDDLWWRARKA